MHHVVEVVNLYSTWHFLQVVCDYFITRSQRLAGKTQPEPYPYQCILDSYRQVTGIDHTKMTSADSVPEYDLTNFESAEAQIGEVGFANKFRPL